MKVMNRDRMKKITADGIKGKVDVWNALTEDPLVAGVRVVHPNSTVPGAGHLHAARQLNYIISGKCEIHTTDESEKTPLKPGDFVLLESNEPHFFTAFDEPVVIFEVRFS